MKTTSKKARAVDEGKGNSPIVTSLTPEQVTAQLRSLRDEATCSDADKDLDTWLRNDMMMARAKASNTSPTNPSAWFVDSALQHGRDWAKK